MTDESISNNHFQRRVLQRYLEAQRISGGAFTNAIAREPAPPEFAHAQKATTATEHPALVALASIRLMGCRCVFPTWDHALNADGWGDEVFMRASVAHNDATGSPISTKTVSTPVYGQASTRNIFGQVFPIPGRAAAGSATDLGGLRQGDGVRWVHPWLDQTSPGIAEPNKPAEVPMILWRYMGPVEQLNGSVAVIPEVWEYDNGEPLDTNWGEQAVRDLSSALKTAGGVAGALAAIPGLQALLTVGATLASVGAVAGTVFRGVKDILGEAGDRPIGQTKNPDGTRTYDPVAMIFDLSKFATASVANQGFGPGVYSVTRQDVNIGSGTYEIFVKLTYEIA